MKDDQAATLLQGILKDIEDPVGDARTEDFSGLRQVDAKVRDARMIIGSLPEFGERLAQEMESDADFSVNSRRVRLEALATYCRSALRLLSVGRNSKQEPEEATRPGSEAPAEI